jgi:hypothetical protein
MSWAYSIFAETLGIFFEEIVSGRNHLGMFFAKGHDVEAWKWAHLSGGPSP